MKGFTIFVLALVCASASAATITESDVEIIASAFKYLTTKRDSAFGDCALCQMIYNQFKNVFRDQRKCEDVKHVMGMFCNELDKGAVASCKAFVTNSMSDIFRVVVRKDARSMCRELKKC